ncbi:MAG: ATP-dependent helicase [Oscillospiraceae bacterium]|nr:ATP-dependent helicase [Oscillospiraceae bacterium]
MLQKIKEKYYGFEMIPLTDVQENIVEKRKNCEKAKNGEKSYGAVLVNGLMQWVNRCEYTNCQNYPCKRNHQVIPRETTEGDTEEEKENLQEFFNSLGIDIQGDIPVFKRDKHPAKVNVIEEQPKKYTAPSEQLVPELNVSNRKYVEITEPDCIIHAPLGSHIILNSGPGTGKTYTIIQRLIYILANQLCPADEIYILCYTRSAKKVIEMQIDDAVTNGLIPPSAKNIYVLTFDSYAAYFLMEMKEQGVITEDFSGYNYNDRIKLLNQHISKEDFEGIGYFIVDEIQDLVNERAEMVLHILRHLQCGYLFAGDRCQAIYDYEADDDATLDSVEFYKRAEKLFPEDMMRYEIVSNRRQTPELAEESAKMRQVLLNKSFLEQNQYANDMIKQYTENIGIEKYIQMLSQSPSGSTAILCRTNGEAEYISNLLCEKKIPHILNRGVNQMNPLPRWIADVFWDYCRETISRNDFMERFQFRCNSSLNPEILWKFFCQMTKSKDETIIYMDKLISALTIVNNIPGDFYEASPLLTVSTIHKAKGSEFDRVILIESNIPSSANSAEEARIRYVALTRPKSQLITMKKKVKYFKRIQSGRILETGMYKNKLYKTKYKYCKSIAVGLNGDIDQTSFVSDISDNFASVLDLQEYITQHIHLYDRLIAERSSRTELYHMIHKGKYIGSLSKQMLNDLTIGVKSTDYKYNLPERLENLYVSGITTEILKKSNENIPVEFQKSRICFGIQITGLAELKFEKK